jgi:hypothetical protein
MDYNTFPYSLIKYNDYFHEKNADIDLLDDFFFNIITLIDLDENLNTTKNIQHMVDGMELNSIEEANAFFSEYFKYTNSIISCFSKLEKTASDDKRFNRIIDIYEVFLNIYNSDFDKMLSIIHANAIQVTEVIFDKYRIIADTADEEIIQDLRGKAGEYNTNRILNLFGILQEYKDSPEIFDKLKTGSLFYSIVDLVFHMNILRKKELSEAGKIKKADNEPGRNDPCPCGSGLKYKKCCLNKK